MEQHPMQNNIHKSSLMALAVVSALGVSSFASAQMLEEVIVTAQRKAETLTEAPVAVSLVSGQDLNDLSIFQADELNKLVTGMEVRYEGDSNTGVGLRGVGTFSQQPTPARVGTYMDDFFMSAQAAAALGNMYDMSNIQILKGPQGTLYGQPSPTGALILTTQDPNFDGVNGHIRGSYMDPNGYNVQGAINFPITETLAVRIAGLTDQRETGVEVKRDETVNPLSSLDEERNLDAIRVKLLWEPSETFSAKLGYHYLESKDSDTYKVVETIDPATANYKDLKADDRIAIADNADEMIDSESTIVTLHLNWMIGDVEVKWFSGMMESLKDSISDEDITDVPEVILAVDTEFGKGGRSDQHELRVSSTAFDIWDWTFGAYYAESWAQTTFLTKPIPRRCLPTTPSPSAKIPN
jgi:iron complex outermembrane receptor protein